MECERMWVVEKYHFLKSSRPCSLAPVLCIVRKYIGELKQGRWNFNSLFTSEMR